MDKVQLKQSIAALEKHNENLEKDLLEFGIDVNEFPEDLTQLLNEYAEIKFRTGLSVVNNLTLQEYYLQKKKEIVENNFAAAKLNIEIDQLKEQIQIGKDEGAVLEKFIKENKTPSDDTQITLSLLENKLSNLITIQKRMSNSDGALVEELMEKIKILKLREAENKK